MGEDTNETKATDLQAKEEEFAAAKAEQTTVYANLKFDIFCIIKSTLSASRKIAYSKCDFKAFRKAGRYD